MEIKVLKEAGYEEGVRGLSYSFKDRAIPLEEWWTQDRFEKVAKTASKLAHRDGGHNKWIESITVWIDIDAPRYWWSEFDTYRVGMTKQSESTMHVLSKRVVTEGDFEDLVDPMLIDALNRKIADKLDIQTLKAHLPESYLQRRIVVTNYKVLRNIILQRWDHRLKLWERFCKEVLSQLEHPELLPNPYKEKTNV